MNKLVNYAFAALFTALFASLGIFILTRLSIPANWAFIAAIVVISLYYVGYRGFRKLEIGFNGVPVLFGERIENTALNEGWIWLFPYIMEVESIDVRERTMDITEAVVVSSNKVRMLIDTQLMWKVTDPYKSLSVGENVIEDGLKKLVINTLREKAKDDNDGDLMVSEKSLSKDINTAADENSDRWGIKTVQVLIPRIIPMDNQVAEAWEKQTREEREKDAERVERDHLIESVDMISDNGKRMSPEVATAVFMAERGKESPIRKVIIEGDGGNPIVKASGVINDGLTKKPANGGA